MITHVAIRFRNQVWALPKPNRHHDVIRLIAEETADLKGIGNIYAPRDDQGFLDHLGRYMSRKQAFFDARACGQLIHQERSSSAMKLGELYSEDLW